MFDYAVLGLGKSGLAALRFLRRRHPKAKVLASDNAASPLLGKSAKEAHPRALIELGGHSDAVLKARYVIKSPGLDPRSSIFKKLNESGKTILSEMDFAFGAMAIKPKIIIGISGTNGKTTTTDLTGHLFRTCGYPALAAGNIGSPLIEAIDQITNKHALILEISSYQLEDSASLTLDCGVLMNITADHLSHHGSWENYVSAKAKLFDFVKVAGLGVGNFEDAAARAVLERASSRRVFFSSARSLQEGAWFEGGMLRVRYSGQRGARSYDMKPAPNLMGVHNLENQMAALLAVLEADMPRVGVEEALETYQPPPHRLERAGSIRDVLFINDSKATNVDSVVAALRALEPLALSRGGKIHLLLGGQDKGASYAPIAARGGQVKKFYCYGEANQLIFKELHAAFDGERCQTLELAMRAALMNASTGDLIVLSPACASFDQFRHYEHRGEEFKRLISALAKELGA
ncbi:MAG: UDP-N-acetylmuramoyl-L-alanine--D-glutamate ligase [Elusimicrobia bacterium]|nr:UDP-N-acetylmuramoyl-L-alanine--D-glutamate ligase [Elusimicrobiota bacterium]